MIATSGRLISVLGLSTLAVVICAAPPRAGQPLPPEQQCLENEHFDNFRQECIQDLPPPDQRLPGMPDHLLSPPPGVIILRPGGVREQADKCPKGFKEFTWVGNWRYCEDLKHPQGLPALATPPIAGIPFEEAEAIVERHTRELLNIPGVNAVGLDARGFIIGVDPDIPVHLPNEIEGLPVNTFPSKPQQGLSHTFTTAIRPMHGGVAVGPNVCR